MTELTMEKLEDSLTGRVVDLSPERSIVQDPIFQAFYRAIVGKKENRLWYRLVYCQEYPDPFLFLKDDQIACEIAKLEPGQYVNYDRIRTDLQKAQSYIQNAPEVKVLMVQACNELIDANVRYVHAAICATGFEMYNRLIDRFFGITKDLQFERLLSSTLPIDSNISSKWPSYGHVKHHNIYYLNFWRGWHRTHADSMLVLKNLPNTRLFLAKFATILEAQAATSSHVEVQPKRSSDTSHTSNLNGARVVLTKRRQAIEKHKFAVQEARSARHQQLKSHNLNNIHQLGEQSRQCLPDGVIQALSAIQEEWKDKLFEEQCLGEYIGDADGEVEYVTGRVEGLHVSNGLTPNGKEEPFDGIIIPDGLMNLAAGASSYL